MKLWKNKFFIICLTVALCLTVFSSVMAATGNSSFLGDAFNVISTPFRFIFNGIADGIKGFGEYFTEYDRLKEENESLKKEQAELDGIRNENEVLKEENEWLRDYLSLNNAGVEYSLSDATVIGFSSSTSIATVTLNKGSLHGIKSGMPVITAQGVVGRVNEVGLTSCNVICITDMSSSIGACIERSALIGICDGKLGDGCSFSYTTGITDFSNVAEGDILITSGAGSIFPYGLTVGTVEKIRIDEASRSVIAAVKPAVDFEDLRRVMIITEVKEAPNE